MPKAIPEDESTFTTLERLALVEQALTILNSDLMYSLVDALTLYKASQVPPTPAPVVTPPVN